MTKKFEIILKYIQDLSVEIPSPDIYLFSREYITKYSLGINITTKPMKNEMIEIITKLHYKDPSDNKRKSYFEIAYATVIKIKDKNLIREELEKIIRILKSYFQQQKHRQKVNINYYNLLEIIQKII